MKSIRNLDQKKRESPSLRSLRGHEQYKECLPLRCSPKGIELLPYDASVWMSTATIDVSVCILKRWLYFKASRRDDRRILIRESLYLLLWSACVCCPGSQKDYSCHVECERGDFLPNSKAGELSLKGSQCFKDEHSISRSDESRIEQVWRAVRE